MRVLLLGLAAASSISAAPLPQVQPSAQSCVSRIEQVRDAAGQPPLDREPARPGQGYLIAAVEKRIDGCPVMQMLGDVNDLRPVPAPSAQPARLQPAH